MMIFLRWNGDSARASGHGAVLAILAMNLRNGADRRPNLFIERGMTVAPSVSASAAYLLILALSAVARVLAGLAWSER